MQQPGTGEGVGDPQTGHLFVVNSELGAIAADARLVPTDQNRYVVSSFQHIVSPEQAASTPWRDGSLVSLVSGTDAWLANIGQREGADPERLRTAVRDFADGVLDGWKEVRRPVACMPVLGTRHGGHGRDKAPAIRAVLHAAQEVAAHHPIDIVLVCFESTMYSAVQRVRRELVAAGDLGWDLGADADVLEDLARELGTSARERRLTLFMGAGTSIGAGLPSWSDLLRKLAEQAGIGDAEVDALSRLDHRDQAAILERRFEERAGRGSFAQAVAELTAAGRCSLTQALLASLHCPEAVTTNYDRLYEIAVRAAGREVAVLPYEPVSGGGSWLLKLHGCVEHQDSIVLTRRDYLGAPNTRGALFGLVQAMLMTRQMLFVGYSLGDEDFHQLIDEVRQARGPGDSDRPALDATVLTLFRDELFAELWARDLRTVSMTAEYEDEDSDAYEPARTLQILLDRAAYEAADATAFLLSPSYQSLLDETEVAGARLLGELDALRTPAGHPLRSWIDRVLREMKAPTTGGPAQ